MAFESYQLDKTMLENSISQFRSIPEYVKICEAFCVGLSTIQNTINYLSEAIDLNRAQGIWLDYLAWLVGTTRETYSLSKYFCLNQTGYFTYYAWTNSGTSVYTLSATPSIGDEVFSDTDATLLGVVGLYANNKITVTGVEYTRNSDNDVTKPVGDLNVEKYFYFEGSSTLDKGSLQDNYLRNKIKAKVAYNTSKATRNENIKIIKGMVNADKVVISNVSPMVLDITIYGNHLSYPSIQSLRQSIEKVIGNGVGIRNLTTL